MPAAAMPATPTLNPPPGAILGGLESAPAIPAATPQPPQVEKVNGVLVAGEKTAETLPKTGSAAVAKENAEGPVLKAIENHPIPPATGEEVLKAVAETADAPKPETAATSPTTAAAETPVESTDAKAAPDAEAEAALEAKRREEVKKELRELGQILLDLKDTRASLVALGLAAGNTAMGDEFRAQILTMILQGRRPDAITTETWKEKKQLYPGVDKETSLFRKFFADHGFPMELFDRAGGEATGAHNVLFQKDAKGHLTDTAINLREELGWTEDHPMPKSKDELARQFGDDPLFIEKMKKVLQTQGLNEYKANWIDRWHRQKQAIAPWGHIGLLAASTVLAIISQGEADSSGRGGQGGH